MCKIFSLIPIIAFFIGYAHGADDADRGEAGGFLKFIFGLLFGVFYLVVVAGILSTLFPNC